MEKKKKREKMETKMKRWIPAFRRAFHMPFFFPFSLLLLSFLDGAQHLRLKKIDNLNKREHG